MREGGPGPLHHYRSREGRWGTGRVEAGGGLSPHSGLLRRRRGPRGGGTQGCEQHGPPEDEVPLGREGYRSGLGMAMESCGHWGEQSWGSGPLASWASVSPPFSCQATLKSGAIGKLTEAPQAPR